MIISIITQNDIPLPSLISVSSPEDFLTIVESLFVPFHHLQQKTYYMYQKASTEFHNPDIQC